jgi:hypothetical protein
MTISDIIDVSLAFVFLFAGLGMGIKVCCVAYKDNRKK